jgi:hypothetical protein
MTISPDTKDWTWVLQRPCPQCGLDTRSISPAGIPTLIRANAAGWHELLGRSQDQARRPDPATWSPLEYACHVREVLRLYLVRLDLMLTADGPHYPNWDQDATAVEGRYGEQDPVVVAAELVAAAELLADRFEQVSGAQWERTVFRSDGAQFTVETFARYFIHDPLHHYYDVTGIPAA